MKGLRDERGNEEQGSIVKLAFNEDRPTKRGASTVPTNRKKVRIRVMAIR